MEHQYADGGFWLLISGTLLLFRRYAASCGKGRSRLLARSQPGGLMLWGCGRFVWTSKEARLWKEFLGGRDCIPSRGSVCAGSASNGERAFRISEYIAISRAQFGRHRPM